MKIILILILLAYTIYNIQVWYYTKRNILTTFVVRFKSGITHYLDLTENITRDELIWRVIRISGEEETDIMGIYNIYGKELEYEKGVWVEK